MQTEVGDNAVTMYHKDSLGRLGEQMLFLPDEARLELAQAGRPWAFRRRRCRLQAEPGGPAYPEVKARLKQKIEGALDTDPCALDQQQDDNGD